MEQPLLQQSIRTATSRLSATGIETAALDARLLLEHALTCSREALIAEGNRTLSAGEIAAYEVLLKRREAREPLAHIIGIKEFFGLNFCVTADTLTPRPDSETLVEAVLERVPRGETIRILDLGTGTGCLLLSLLHALPDASGTGTDISSAALAVAKRNAGNMQLAERVEFLEGDWCSPLKAIKYQIVVANPPYIVSDALRALMPEVVKFEPHLALDGGKDGLDCYRRIAEMLPPHLAEGALVATEAGVGQSDAIASIFAEAGFCVETIKRDLSGIPRCVVLRWPAA